MRTTIKLQQKGPPEKPEALTPISIGHNFVTLKYTPGFDGGVHETKYFVSYKRTADTGEDDCVNTRRTGAPDSWHEVDCQRNNPCNVTSLDQHTRYIFKVILRFALLVQTFTAEIIILSSNHKFKCFRVPT